MGPWAGWSKDTRERSERARSEFVTEQVSTVATWQAWQQVQR